MLKKNRLGRLILPALRHTMFLLFSHSVVSDSFMIPRTVAGQSMGFSRQEYWSGLPFPSPGGLPDPGIEPMSPSLAGRFLTTEAPGKPKTYYKTGWHWSRIDT